MLITSHSVPCRTSAKSPGWFVNPSILSFCDVIDLGNFRHSHAPRPMPICSPLVSQSRCANQLVIEMATIEVCGRVLLGRGVGHRRGAGEARPAVRRSLYL